MAVGAEHHPAGEGVVLEHDLVDDAGPRPPEADPVLPGDAAEELVDLGVRVERGFEVFLGAGPGLDEVVAMDGRRDRHPGEAGQGELEERHLRRGVLHRHPVRTEVAVVDAPAEADGDGVVGMGEEDLLGQGQRPAQPLRTDAGRLGVSGVGALDEFERRAGTNLLRHLGLRCRC
jgi:hypothetical protein